MLPESFLVMGSFLLRATVFHPWWAEFSFAA
jgi:hypothetical protein